MIRVLHVVHTMECGGIETMLMNLYRKFDKTKVQFDFLVNGSGKNYYTDEILNLGGRIYPVTPKRVNFFKNLRETYAVMKQGKYQIVHIHQDSMIGFAIFCARLAHVKMIIAHAHTTSANGWHRRLAAILARSYIRKYADIKCACSFAAAAWIYGKKEKDVLIIKNAIDAEKFRYCREVSIQNRRELGIGEDTFVIGTCGRLSEEKNQAYLLAIFRELKKIKPESVLILVGDGDKRKELEELAKEYKIREAVLFVGMTDKPEFYYSVMDCFVLPSIFEGLPLAGVEAQAAGLVCFFSSGVTKELAITPNVFFEEITKDPKVWAEQMDKQDKMDTFEWIQSAGYDIGENVKKLQSLYLSI